MYAHYIFLYALQCTLTSLFKLNSVLRVGSSRCVLYNLFLTQVAKSLQCRRYGLDDPEYEYTARLSRFLISCEMEDI